MGDSKLRGAERAWRESGELAAEALYLRERARTGGVSQEGLRLAALCEHEAAKVALGASGSVSSSSFDRDEVAPLAAVVLRAARRLGEELPAVSRVALASLPEAVWRTLPSVADPALMLEIAAEMNAHGPIADSRSYLIHHALCALAFAASGDLDLAAFTFSRLVVALESSGARLKQAVAQEALGYGSAH